MVSNEASNTSNERPHIYSLLPKTHLEEPQHKTTSDTRSSLDDVMIGEFFIAIAALRIVILWFVIRLIVVIIVLVFMVMYWIELLVLG